jgi:hypothetical protein
METKKISRYVRRDSQKYNNPPQFSKNTSRNIQSKENIKDNNVKNNKIKKQLSTYILRTDYTRSKTGEITSLHKSPSQITIPTINKIRNISDKFSYSNSRKISQPRTPLVSSSINKNKNIFENKTRREIKTPQISINNNDVIKVNNLTYYLRCPYCNHTLNNVSHNDRNEKIGKNYYQNYTSENKENINENISYSNIYKTEKKYKKILKEEKSNHKSFYINKNGVIVFTQNDKPTTSIQIVNTKPDFSKYTNESKVFGKKKNIGIYEGPVPITKVFVRPIKI